MMRMNGYNQNFGNLGNFFGQNGTAKSSDNQELNNEAGMNINQTQETDGLKDIQKINNRWKNGKKVGHTRHHGGNCKHIQKDLQEIDSVIQNTTIKEAIGEVLQDFFMAIAQIFSMFGFTNTPEENIPPVIDNQTNNDIAIEDDIAQDETVQDEIIKNDTIAEDEITVEDETTEDITLNDTQTNIENNTEENETIIDDKKESLSDLNSLYSVLEDGKITYETIDGKQTEAEYSAQETRELSEKFSTGYDLNDELFNSNEDFRKFMILQEYYISQTWTKIENQTPEELAQSEELPELISEEEYNKIMEKIDNFEIPTNLELAKVKMYMNQ